MLYESNIVSEPRVASGVIVTVFHVPNETGNCPLEFHSGNIMRVCGESASKTVCGQGINCKTPAAPAANSK